MRTITLSTVLGILLFWSAVSCAQQPVDAWRYTLQRPADGWEQPGFDDRGWKDGNGGFGTHDTPGARVGTTWATNNIWLRKSFELNSIPEQPALLVHHDEDAHIYLNGKLISEMKGYSTEYEIVRLSQDSRGVLRQGTNQLAVHCHQSTGGQFIDVHLVDANNVPDLPRPKRSTKPFVSDLVTKWGKNVTPENAWTEYPRPQLRRNHWTNLNGNWNYAVTSRDETSAPDQWDGTILVPYCLESKLGGVQRLLDATEALWYHRTFRVKKLDKQLRLNFEAVDYRCEVFVNGQSVGKHVGGNTPFAFDITKAVREGDNELVVRVEDATEQWQLRGKQVINARSIWYTQVSGIWQTVWLEEVSPGAIAQLRLQPSPSASQVRIDVQIDGQPAHNRIGVVVKSGDEVIHRQSFTQTAASGEFVEGGDLTIPRDKLKLWSPAAPHLYDLEITLYRHDDRGAASVVDRVYSYVGMREVGKAKDADGHWRFTLNGQPIFHWGPLDQGWWPDGLLTPPSDEAMLFDIEWLKSAGFNMIRKHIKVEPRRYYYHCDRLGMMVWQDHVSGGVGKAWPAWTRLKPNPVDANWPDDQHEQFMLELERMISSLESHPSIVCWVPFNERWGQHRTMDVGKWTVQRDPFRLVNVASGGNFWPVGDVVDEHSYPHPQFPFDEGRANRFDDYIKVMGEFGGHGYPITGHLWDANRRNWGYGDIPKTKEEYKARYVTSLRMLNELRKQGIAGGVYTQTTDVEGEINGLMTYDREVIKIPAPELATLHKVLFEANEPSR